MRNLRMLLTAGLDVSVPGLSLSRLTVHRHLPEHPEIQHHAHDFSQLLLYLGGIGKQQIGEELHPVSAGSCALIAPGAPHAFVRTTGRPPLCMVLDFKTEAEFPSRVLRVPGTEQAEIRAALQRIAKLERNGTTPAHIECIGVGIQILGWLLALFEPKAPRVSHNQEMLERKIMHLLATPEGLRISIKELASKLGYQQDYLNRLLKARTGLTLTAYRSKARMAAANSVLRKGGSATAAAEHAGFDDLNYFVRWYKQQTGVTPGAAGQAAS